jgi:MipA family protein
MRRTIIIATAAVFAPGLASAQGGTGKAPHKNWSSQIGISTVAMPTYPGSNRYRTRVFPILALEFKERVYIGGAMGGTGAGTGLYVVRNPAFSLSAGISGAPERKESHGDGLAGMGRRGGATFGASDVSYKFGSILAGAGVQVGLGGSEGSTASFNLSTQKVYGRRWIAGLSTGATFANSENMAYDFGVSPGQAVRRQALIDAGDSRLHANEGRMYSPKEGLKQAQVSTSLGYLITPRTSAMAFAMGSRLGSQAADSPLARQRNGVSAGLGLVFGL